MNVERSGLERDASRAVLMAASLLVLALGAGAGCSTRVAIGELPPNEPSASSDGTNPPPSGGGSGSATDASGGSDGGGENDAKDGGGVVDAGPYVPCAGKTCGQTCALCAPNDPQCVETGVVKFCHPGGECKDMPPACVPPPPYVPCAGKVCGQTCTICDPTDVNCVETAVLKECSKTGQCLAANANCN